MPGRCAEINHVGAVSLGRSRLSAAQPNPRNQSGALTISTRFPPPAFRSTRPRAVGTQHPPVPQQRNL